MSLKISKKTRTLKELQVQVQVLVIYSQQNLKLSLGWLANNEELIAASQTLLKIINFF